MSLTCLTINAMAKPQPTSQPSTSTGLRSRSARTSSRSLPLGTRARPATVAVDPMTTPKGFQTSIRRKKPPPPSMPLVTPTGDNATFSVTSADDADSYFVDIAANGGFMACTCRDWQCRVAPRLRGGQRIKPYGNPNRGVCKHQQSVLLFLGQSVAAQLSGKNRCDIFEDKL
jgi:hypothetical protein